MKKIFAALVLVCLLAPSLMAQGIQIPWVRPQYFTNLGGPIANGFLCTYLAGGTTNLTTYSEPTLTTSLPNPIRLNSAGRTQTNSSGAGTETQVYVNPGVGPIKFVLYAAGTGNTCNGVNVGTTIWTQDNILPSVQLNDLDCSAFPGANAGARLAACITALPSTGGTADIRGLEGAQSWSSNPFTGVTKPVTLLIGAATHTISTSLTIPANVTLDFSQGGVLSIASGTTATINGHIQGTLSQHFAGVGGVDLRAAKVDAVRPEWFGAIPDGSTDNSAFVQKAIDSMGSRVLQFSAGTYNFVTGLRISEDRAHLRGVGQTSTTLQFSPGAGVGSVTFIHVQADTAGVLFEGSLTDLLLYSTNSTRTKVALNLIDTSNYEVARVKIHGSVGCLNLGAGVTATCWSDASEASTALQLNGREATNIHDIELFASKPIVIGLNPNASGTLDSDHTHIHDAYLLASGSPIIEFLTGIVVTNFAMDGIQAWVGGTYGAKFDDSTGVTQSIGMTFKNVRHENPQGSTGYGIYIDANVVVRQLRIEDSIFHTTNQINGFYFRNVQEARLDNTLYLGDQIAFNADSTVSDVYMFNTWLGLAGSTVSASGFVNFTHCGKVMSNAADRCSHGTFVKDQYETYPNAAYQSARNQANTATIPMIGVSTGNLVTISPNGVLVNVGGTTGNLNVGHTFSVGGTGQLMMGNGRCVGGINAAGNNGICAVAISGTNEVSVDSAGVGTVLGGSLQLGTAPVVVSGGTAAALGGITGGPASASQVVWQPIKASNGQTYYIPLFQFVLTGPFWGGLLYWLRRRRRV